MHNIRIESRAIIGSTICNPGDMVRGSDEFASGLRQAGVLFTIVEAEAEKHTDRAAEEPPTTDRRHNAKPVVVEK